MRNNSARASFGTLGVDGWQMLDWAQDTVENNAESIALMMNFEYQRMTILPSRQQANK
jgi:hypothetical protein